MRQRQVVLEEDARPCLEDILNPCRKSKELFRIVLLKLMDYLQVNYGKSVGNLYEIGFHFVKHQLFTFMHKQ